MLKRGNVVRIRSANFKWDEKDAVVIDIGVGTPSFVYLEVLPGTTPSSTAFRISLLAHEVEFVAENEEAIALEVLGDGYFA